MIIEVWVACDADGNYISSSCFAKEHKIQNLLMLQKEMSWDKDIVKVRKLNEITGKDWNDCMMQHHKFMGYEPYIPMGNASLPDDEEN